MGWGTHKLAGLGLLCFRVGAGPLAGGIPDPHPLIAGAGAGLELPAPAPAPVGSETRGCPHPRFELPSSLPRQWVKDYRNEWRRER